MSFDVVTRFFVSPSTIRGFARVPALKRFIACEDGATTAEFVLAAAAAVVLAVGVVTATQTGTDGAAVRTVVAMDKHSSEIDRRSTRSSS